ncbi:SAMHD1 like [Spatholobus suberectus]|nr:SAMHD1 like [Spatholobus suberectus]
MDFSVCIICIICNIVWQKSSGITLKAEDVVVCNVKIDLTRKMHNPLEREATTITREGLEGCKHNEDIQDYGGLIDKKKYHPKHNREDYGGIVLKSD